jgi:uncharacterized protein (DUF1501 family)
MNRRKFIKQIAIGSAAPLILNNLPLNALAAESPLMKMLASSNSDRILVFLQLHGGNDGLNMLIPIKNYSKYYELRPNIAIPDYGSRKYLELDNTLPEQDRVGLHPDMEAVQQLYQSKRASIVQAVGYENMNLSHFRGRDIWFMGCDSNERLPSGWMGRFLDQSYPGYPDSYPNAAMPDPLGLEMGNDVSLAFMRENSIPAGISIQNPQAFFDLINSVGIDAPTASSFPDSHYGLELEYLTKFEKKTNDFAQRLKQVYDAGTNSPSVTYPSSYPLLTPIPYIKNQLSEQFRIIARLISGGIKTRIFLTRITGFDTHAGQVEPSSSSQGRHAALLYHISESVKAFHNDLFLQGFGDKVLTMTYSEFGRRAYSNASYGTDHGKAGPIMMFGSGLKGGVYGTNPNLNDLDNGNIRPQFDYRQVYTTVLSDWLGASNASITDSGLGDFLDQKLDLIANPLSVEPEKENFEMVLDCYPNPARDYVKVIYTVQKSSKIQINLYDNQGKLVKEIINMPQKPGKYLSELNLSDIKSGIYILKFESGKNQISKTIIKN